MILLKFTEVDYYTYDIISNLPKLNELDAYSLNLRLKRQLNVPVVTENATQPQSPSTLQTNIPNDRSITSKQPPDPAMVVINSGANGEATIFDAATAKATTTPPRQIPDRPLLGVNGTGQRKYFPQKPPLVSEPISTVEVNRTLPSYNIDDIIKNVDVSSNATSEQDLAVKHNLTIKYTGVSGIL